MLVYLGFMHKSVTGRSEGGEGGKSCSCRFYLRNILYIFKQIYNEKPIFDFSA
ncbi:hypothetical protein HMPREF2533_00138 [Bacteroides fragilis]|nr:hypothetical protein M073_3685 [Bacteroides fragilis str. DS-71]EYA07522.1 hypothetical protein M130_4236 [Bacteroides fragilis str. S6R6]EYB03141.1 hypothetical protein M129_4265 [Bacteroides fragilis str. S6R5]KXU51108.1 hypothetical protein HMPREF2530_00138 [Bacteroides fragilis]KXU51248.1 hypothetical protein HMPREF2533_00138 [Bacteroides fragilis]